MINVKIDLSDTNEVSEIVQRMIEAATDPLNTRIEGLVKETDRKEEENDILRHQLKELEKSLRTEVVKRVAAEVELKKVNTHLQESSDD